MHLYMVLYVCFSDLSYNNLSGPVPRFAAKTFRYVLLIFPSSPSAEHYVDKLCVLYYVIAA